MTTAQDRTTGINTNTVRRLTAQDIADQLGMTKALALRDVIPRLEAAGVLVQRGKGFYGRMSDIEAAMMTKAAA